MQFLATFILLAVGSVTALPTSLESRQLLGECTPACAAGSTCLLGICLPLPLPSLPILGGATPTPTPTIGLPGLPGLPSLPGLPGLSTILPGLPGLSTILPGLPLPLPTGLPLGLTVDEETVEDK